MSTALQITQNYWGRVNNYILYTKGHKEMPIMLTSE